MKRKSLSNSNTTSNDKEILIKSPIVKQIPPPKKLWNFVRSNNNLKFHLQIKIIRSFIDQIMKKKNKNLW